MLDNFEWQKGYSMRLGLVHVDFATQKRTIKESGYWYKRVIKTNGEIL
ncbi:family 1 glycosylhydrolase [Paenibacillus roseipurpureus]|uniref:Family 1 glycosylhydrolase n=1 Tax=Paenibacillus roseopurpureus TaxID=2918901 RepID=A0AA96LPV1_9BACL|nr:family 1 glycosylhydrolase [Paenibacillus sp. MBLB1832]WNR46052.1 family 1 glycosylhydrolase [Paenibacillus sp. MBLB1832]